MPSNLKIRNSNNQWVECYELNKSDVTEALGYTPLQTQDISGKLDKTTYEYNLELRATGANSGQTILIGKFPCYDTNITIKISATTSTTYNGTLVIATQNIAPGATGVLNATVYGDANNTITPAINIERESVSGSRIIAVYFKPQSYSKNLFHIQCQTPSAAPTDMMTWVSSVTAGEVRYTPVNALTANFNKYTLPTAASSTLGGIKLGYTNSGKNYKVQVDGSGNAYVNVPWTDNNTWRGIQDNLTSTSTTDSLSANQGKILDGKITTLNDTLGPLIEAKQDKLIAGDNITIDGDTISATNTTYTIATASKAGLVKPVSVITKPTLQSVTTTSGRYYQIQMSSDGNMFVNVPWTVDTDTDVKVTNTLNTSSKYYITGTTSASTNTGTQIFDTSVYVNTTSGALHATTFNVDTNATIEYDSNYKALKFVFAA